MSFPLGMACCHSLNTPMSQGTGAAASAILALALLAAEIAC